MRKFLFISTIALSMLSSCGSTSSYVLKANDRLDNRAFDSLKDTLVEVARKQNNKIDFIVYRLNSKIIKLLSYRYLKNGEYTIEPSKGFFSKMHGNFYWYHPDSTLKMTTMYVNGNKEGTYLSYYPNKNPQCICSYHDDKRNGLQIIHWETGKVFMKAQYNEGKLINIYEYNNKEGKLRDYGTLKDGNGTFIHYKDDESIEYVEEYQNGIMIKTSQDKNKSKTK
jgi:hypothetical protein